MAEKTVQQRLAEAEAKIEEMQGGQDAMLFCIAKLVEQATSRWSAQATADLIDGFRVNVDPDEVATWQLRKRRIYEHTVRASNAIADQFLVVALGGRDGLAETLNQGRREKH
jgi:hypothetical protein